MLTLIVATAAFLLLVYFWNQMNFRWSSNLCGSAIWVILELHSLDLVADLLVTLVLLLILVPGRNGAKQRLGVHWDSLTWYFIAAIWIPLYAVIYLGPYLLRGR